MGETSDSVNDASREDIRQRAFFDYENLKNFINHDAQASEYDIVAANAALEELYSYYTGSDRKIDFVVEAFRKERKKNDGSKRSGKKGARHLFEDKRVDAEEP